MTLLCQSIANITESHLVQELLAHPQWRSRLLAIRGIPDDVHASTNVSLLNAPGNNGKGGDVDILLCSPGRPDLATAVTVKRFKVRPPAFDTEQPNKLGGFKKAVQQANQLAKFGFAQVYLFILVVVDSREQNNGRIGYIGLSAKLKNVIEQAISLGGLHQRIGLMRYYFVQPMDDAPLGTGTYQAHLIRMATEVTQPTALTDWVRRAISDRINGGARETG